MNLNPVLKLLAKLKVFQSFKPKNVYYIGETTAKDLVRRSILPGEKVTRSVLRDKLDAAAHTINNDWLEQFNPSERISYKQIKAAMKGLKRAYDYYGSARWKHKAMQYGHMTKQEAEATSKFLQNNIRRTPIIGNVIKDSRTEKGISSTASFDNGESSGISYIGFKKNGDINWSTPIHEAHHAAMLNNGKLDPTMFGLTDQNVINGMQKLVDNMNRLGKLANENISMIGRIRKRVDEKDFNYLFNPEEIRSRVLTGQTLGKKWRDIRSDIDRARAYINPEIYSKIYKQMFGTIPIIGGGLYGASKLNDDNEEGTY